MTIKPFTPLFLACCFTILCLDTAVGKGGAAQSKIPALQPLPGEHLRVQGLNRAVRYYQPVSPAEHPALVIALHGGGGDGERFRHFTNRAFERQADEHGFLVAYPDALGGQWNGCRARAPYRAALAGVDDVAFLRAVAKRAGELSGLDLTKVFVVGYSNGGHVVFRLALETPQEFDALAVISAHLPVSEELDCVASSAPVSILLVSGTENPINPWSGGEVLSPNGGSPGKVFSAETTIAYFHNLAASSDQPIVEQYEDRDAGDGTWVESHRWIGNEQHEIMLMTVHGGGHTLPHPTAQFPEDLVGRTNRDIDGASEIWRFFARHLGHD